MIVYLATRAHTYTMRFFLNAWGGVLRPRVRVMAYEDLPRLAQLPFASYIFSDLERLPPSALEAAARVHAALREAHGDRIRLLNHPTRSLRRYELLRRLHEAGINRFNVYRATERPRPQRFPVFLRREDDHAGALDTGLADQAALEARLAALRNAGTSLDPMIVTEWLDTADANGVYRKYSAFVIGERVLPRHVFFSRGWSVKYPDLVDPDQVAEELAYMRENPHRDTLRRVFELAGIGYGRIDYSLHEGQLQVWEINTNPWIMSYKDGGRDRRREAYRMAWSGVVQALEALSPATGAPVPNPLFQPEPPRSHRVLRGAMRRVGLVRLYGPLVECVRSARRAGVRQGAARQAAEN